MRRCDTQATSDDGYFMSFKEFPPGWENATSRLPEDQLSRSSGSNSSLGTTASNVTFGSPISRGPQSPRSPRAHSHKWKGGHGRGDGKGKEKSGDGSGRRESVEAFTEGEERAALLTLRARALGVAARLVHHTRADSASKRRIPDVPGGFTGQDEGVWPGV